MIKTSSVVCAAVLVLMTQVLSGAHFVFLMDDLSTGGPDGQGHQQLWTTPGNWMLDSGVDDGGNGYPDGADTFAIDRTANLGNPSRLTNEGNTIGFVAGITGTGTGNQDIVFKHGGDNTIGDLTLLASANPFHIREERDRSLTINGVISGVGSLLLSRSGGFSDGVDPDELITITGTSPNTLTGTVRLYNDNNFAPPDRIPQPSYWVADKVGAFGQASQLTLEGRAGANGGIASLRITANAVGGEGAIDDDATTVFIGAKGVLSLDAGVDERIGVGNLFIDLLGTGTYSEVAEGTYDNTEDWISGDGTVTVGEPGPGVPFAITEIDYDPTADTVTLTWTSRADATYIAKYSFDMTSWDADMGDGLGPANDEVPEDGDLITVTFNLADFLIENFEDLFFRIEEE